MKLVIGWVMMFLMCGYCLLLGCCGTKCEKTASLTPEDVTAFVAEAVTYAETVGKEAACREFSNKKGKFIRGDLYIYAYDFAGTVLAHGNDPKLVGKNLIQRKDLHGKYIIQELRDIAASEAGEGWLRSSWERPNSTVEAEKLLYVRKVDDSWWLGSGLYK